jgi:hypothetical protein
MIQEFDRGACLVFGGIGAAIARRIRRLADRGITRSDI